MTGRHRAREWPSPTWLSTSLIGLGAFLTTYSMVIVAFALIAGRWV